MLYNYSLRAFHTSMTKKEVVDNIIKLIKSSIFDARNEDLSLDTRLMDIPGLDSMSLVNLQMDLKDVYGDKMDSILPSLDMKISDLADLIMSL